MNKLLQYYKLHFILLGSFIGFIAWSFNDIRLTLFSLLIFYAYIKINKRIDLVIIVFSYLLVSSRGLLIGTITYYDNSILSGLTVWLSAAVLTTIPFILVWSKNRATRFILLPLLIAVLVLPGFGYISWVNPIVSAALIFPGMGFLGLILFLLFFYLYFGVSKLFKGVLIAILAFNVIVKFPTENNTLKQINKSYETSLQKTETVIINTTYNLFPFLPKSEYLNVNKKEVVENFILSRLATILIPGLNVLMLILFLLTLSLILSIYKRFGKPISLILVIFILLNTKYNLPKNQNFKELNTKYNYDPESIDFRSSYKRQSELLNKVNNITAKTVVAPESILGFYNSNSSSFIWSRINKNLLAGAYIQDKKNIKMYDNVVMQITPKIKKVLYKQRVPVLISMWRPWEKTGTHANLFKNPKVRAFNKDISFFICYEQLLDFVIYHSAFNDPDIFIGVSNLWWANNTTIEIIQINKLKLYSMLFNKPLVFSINR